jgi:hydrogenase maturation factor
MRVLEIDTGRELALCADDADRRSTVETALVQPVAVGDELLVHAGTAIVRLGGEGVAA